MRYVAHDFHARSQRSDWERNLGLDDVSHVHTQRAFSRLRAVPAYSWLPWPLGLVMLRVLRCSAPAAWCRAARL